MAKGFHQHDVGEDADGDGGHPREHVRPEADRGSKAALAFQEEQGGRDADRDGHQGPEAHGERRSGDGVADAPSRDARRGGIVGQEAEIDRADAPRGRVREQRHQRDQADADGEGAQHQGQPGGRTPAGKGPPGRVPDRLAPCRCPGRQASGEGLGRKQLPRGAPQGAVYSLGNDVAGLGGAQRRHSVTNFAACRLRRRSRIWPTALTATLMASR